MKNILSIVLILLSLGMIHAKPPGLTTDYLVNTSWKKKMITGVSEKITFTGDGKFEIYIPDVMMPVWEKYNGTYKIEKGYILCSDVVYTSKESGRSITFEKPVKLLLVELKDHFDWKYGIKPEKPLKTEYEDRLRDFIMYDTTNLVKAGDSRSLKNQTVIAVKQEGLTTANLKVRTGPSTTYDAVKISFDINITEPVKHSLFKELPYIPAGYPLTILGRTEKKEQVGEWNNYWYFVKFAYSEDMFTNYMTGWVFGEFVTVQ